MKIAYKKTGWKATDIRFVPDDYTPQQYERIVDGDKLPSIEELSDPPPPPDPRKALDDAESAEAKVHAQTIQFLNMTPTELDAWCDQNLPAGGTRIVGKVLGRLAQQAARGKFLR